MSALSIDHPHAVPAAPPAPEGYMRDAVGNLIAIENIRPIDLARDELVKELAACAMEMSAKLEALKIRMGGDIQSFVELSAERYGVKLGGKKGNLKLESFDGELRVEQQVSVYITFDEGIQATKELIDECVRDWSKDSGPELRTLVDHAFRVDKKGKLNVSAILGLRRLEINDERWKRAMQALSDSVKPTGSATYVRVHKRDSKGHYHLIPLDIAAL